MNIISTYVRLQSQSETMLQECSLQCITCRKRVESGGGGGRGPSVRTCLDAKGVALRCVEGMATGDSAGEALYELIAQCSTTVQRMDRTLNNRYGNETKQRGDSTKHSTGRKGS